MKFAFWVNTTKGVTFQILHDEAMNNEYDRAHGVAPPVKINPIFEELDYAQLKCIYPCPAPAPMPKVKRQEG
jgi:hypothetical protein